VCVPRDGGDSFVLEPAIPFSLTPLFIKLDSLYTGELLITGDYPNNVDPTTLNTINTLRNLGVSYISGLQDISVSFKNDSVADSLSPIRNKPLPPTPFLRLITSTVIDTTINAPLDELVPVNNWELFPSNKPWYPVAWTGNQLTLIAPGNEGYLAGFIRYPVDGKAVLRTNGSFLPFNTPLINDDYFLDLSQPNYISLYPPTTSTVVGLGRGINQYTLQLQLEVKVWR
jgi:hypothetical protein